MTEVKNILSVLAIASIALLTSCSKQEQVQPGDTSQAAAAAMKQGEGKAVLLKADTAAKTVTLDHNTIPGIMDAMTMEYPVSDPALLRAASVGDSVTFTLEDRGDGNYLVTRITPMKK
ncbi:MAG TPA: copper-binding protein [Candidatus Kapabacteria bacterium]|nr:copper-binding protein [Candidatus Kapabacteria bacterium]